MASIEASVHEGGCSGDVLYRAVLRDGQAGMALPLLGRGTYGFRAHALDAECVIFAEGCVQVSLPAGDPHVLVVLDERTPSPACDSSACGGGGCQSADSGAPVTDSGAPDASESADSGAPDASPTIDASAPPLVPSNIPGDTLLAGTVDLVLREADGTIVIDTDAATIVRASDSADRRPDGLEDRLVPQLGTAPDLRVFVLRSLHVEEGADVRVIGAAALVFAVAGEAIVDGVIDVRGGRTTPEAAGAGGFAGGTALTRSGGGPGGGLADIAREDVGGGGGAHAGRGGAGGARGGVVGGAAGRAFGERALVPLVGGSGGGFGGGGDAGGVGGGGGGAVQISAARIRIGSRGGINAGGGGGRGGRSDDGGGGGGAGGAILLEALAIDVDGALAANGGGGGAGANVSVEGRAGQSGRLGSTEANGGDGAGEGTSGGDGAAGDRIDGEAGASASSSGLDNSGGGGGGGGRIHLRAASIDRDGATLSPAAGVTTASL
ncbi:PE-PGRS family protein [Sandaracinus amylolyticus]|uniref:PE-PGRS family protein n=1 Tax=Sandaracinus amylolyticus TaxID=927083 RepID=A0A0F6SGH4_9BACT|nr:PE-PGRS family protein [Sandaracinus amylolyticus]